MITSTSFLAICRLPVETGPCRGSFNRWYFDFSQRTCVPFTYGGCAGNLNRFKSFEICVGYCERAIRMAVSGDDRERPVRS